MVRASDAEREAVIARLQTALGEGRIDLDEFGQRAEAAYAAVTTADLDRLMADLPAGGPPPVEIVGTRAPEEISSFFGDIRLAGGSAPQRAGTFFGDVRIDLRGLRTDADRVDLYLSTVFGDIEVIVSEGVDAAAAGADDPGRPQGRPGTGAAAGRHAARRRARAEPSSATSGCGAWRRASRRAGGGRC